jgi:hypothetical protein
MAAGEGDHDGDDRDEVDDGAEGARHGVQNWK